MGLFHDTLHDARRPISGVWVRRAEMAAPESPPEEDFSQDSMPSGMQTVFRFQKAGRIPSREASIQTGGESSRLPAGDPLTAGAEVESPKSPATNERVTDISVMGDSSVSELATGQVIHGSPGKVAAASVKSESKTHQSVVLPEPIETDSYHAMLSETPEGGERLVSEQSETFLSRPTGRGAPSETYPSSFTRARAAAVTRPDSPPNVAVAVLHDDPGPAREFAASPREAWREANGGAPAKPTGLGRAAYPRASAAEPAPPGLVIGRIDVVVVANAAPAAAPAPANTRAERGFLSRNYLKRL